MELRMYKKVDADFPNEKSTLSAFGGKANLLRRFGEWVRANSGYEDVAAMLPQPIDSPDAQPKAAPLEGLVFLIRSGGHYKIGRSDEIERRVKEIRVALAEAATLVHSIRTDDPAGQSVVLGWDIIAPRRTSIAHLHRPWRATVRCCTTLLPVGTHVTLHAADSRTCTLLPVASA
jgi:hypothetical protein